MSKIKLNQYKQKPFPLVTSLIIMVSAFALFSAFLFIKLINNKALLEKEILTKETSISDKDKMIIKLRTLEIEYDELSNEYSDLDGLFALEKKKVSELLNEIKKIKGSTDLFKIRVQELENRLREYLSLIDDLKEKNTLLISENANLYEELDSITASHNELSMKNQEYANLIEISSKVKAYDILAEGIRIRSGNKEVATTNYKKVQNFRICFLLGENLIIPQGRKSVYIRIADPDGVIINKTPENVFMYNGRPIVYTIKQDIIYNNKAMDLCVYWHKDRELKKGRYEIFIFLDKYEIGRTSINLK